MSLVGGMMSSWLMRMYWLRRFLSSSFWLWSSPVSLMSFWRDWRRSWYLAKLLSRTFQMRKVRSGSAWVIFSQYFLPSRAIRSFFSRSDNCFSDFLVVRSSIFLRSSRPLIHSTRKSTTSTGSTLKSLARSTRGSSSSTAGSTRSTFFSSPLFFFFLLARSSSSRASCSRRSRSSCCACFSFSLTYRQALARSSMKMLSSSTDSMESVFLSISSFSLSFSSWLARSSSSRILSSKMKSPSSMRMSRISASLSSETARWVSCSSSSSFSTTRGFSSGRSSSGALSASQSSPSCWLWMTLSHLMILSLSSCTSFSFMACISLQRSRSDFSKCLNLRWSSLNWRVMRLQSAVSCLLVSLKRWSSFSYCARRLRQRVLRRLSFFLSSSWFSWFSSFFSLRILRLQSSFSVLSWQRAFISSQHFSRFWMSFSILILVLVKVCMPSTRSFSMAFSNSSSWRRRLSAKELSMLMCFLKHSSTSDLARSMQALRSASNRRWISSSSWMLWSRSAKYCSRILLTSTFTSVACSFSAFEYWSSFFFSSSQNSLMSLSLAATMSLKASFCSWMALERDSHSSYSLSSDHLISRAVFFLLEATASCWMAIRRSCARRSSKMREFFWSCSFLTRSSTMASLRSWQTRSMPLKLVSICRFPSCMKLYYRLIRMEGLAGESLLGGVGTAGGSRVALHPSLVGGFTLLYDNSLPVEMKYVDYDRNVNHLGSSEQVNFRIYTNGSKPNITRIKIQIESDNDPFFIAKFECDEHFFGLIRKEQKLTISLQELPTIIIKCLNRIEESKRKLNAGLLVYSDGKSRLCLNYTSEFKNIEILHLDLNQENDERLEEVIKFKYQALRQSIAATEARLAKINQIIRDKNPSLLMQIHKSTRKD